MRPLLAVVLLVLGVPFNAVAQSGSFPRLERTIDIDFPVRSVIDDCTVPRAVAGLASWYKFAAGIEYPRAECARMGVPPGAAHGELLNFRFMTIEAALNKLVAMDPRYRWIDSDGVIVVRPHAAWTDARNMLNFETERFELEDTTMGGALAAIVSAITGEPQDPMRFSERTAQAALRFDVKTRITSAGEALDAIVRAHGASYWTVREGTVIKDGRQVRGGRSITFHTFDGAAIGVGSPKLQ